MTQRTVHNKVLANINVSERSVEKSTPEELATDWLIYRDVDRGACDIHVHIESKQRDHWIGWISGVSSRAASGRFPYGLFPVLLNGKIEYLTVNNAVQPGDYIL